MKEVVDFYRAKNLLCEFEPKRGIDDFPKMLDAVVNFSNERNAKAT